MDPDNDYNDYSTLDAPQQLENVLDRFFSNKQNTYKYALAYKHFKSVVNQNTFIDANRYFKILTGTNLVTKKHVLQYRTTQGMRYRIKKEYAQSNQRDLRNIRRTQQKQTRSQDENVVSHTPASPFVQLMKTKTPLDDTSSDDSSEKSVIPNQPTNPVAGVEESKDDPEEHTPTPPSEAKSTFQSELTEHAAALEKTMDTAMADLADPEPPHDNIAVNMQLETLIQQTVERNLVNTLQRLDRTETKLSALLNKHDELQLEHIKLQTKYDDLQVNYDRLNRQVNFNSRALENSEERITSIETSTKTLQKTIVSTISDEIKSLSKEIQHGTTHSVSKNDDALHILSAKQDKFQRRLARLKDGTSTMFKDMENDYDMLTDRIHRLESDVSNMKVPKQSASTARKLDYGKTSESDDSSFSTFPQKHKSSEYVPQTPKQPYRNTYYRGPNIDYLRKNVNITCSEQNQILEFYIKFRLVLEQGGIHIVPIDKISKHTSIAQDKPGITQEDQRLQSNALFTLLSNEKIIPSDFTMAQNCIQGFASTMDGFGALRAMLKLTHPTLSKKRPSNVPPVLSDSSDIHSYEQNLRNFYLLHKLFSDIEFSPIEKAKQFLQGMDDGQYMEAVQRVQHQLDTFESLKVPLTEDYDIDNMASTIINISSEYENTKTVVNTMRQNSYPNYNHQKVNQQYTKRSPHTQFSQRPTPKTHSEKFDKTQCFACKQFGHTVTHCRLLPKVLAVLQFKSKYSDKCEAILRQHICNNTIDSKRVFVRTLQNMNILSQTEDSDEFLEHDIIVNTMTDNGIDNTDLHSEDE